MKDITIFNNSQFGEIRTSLSESGDPLFCLVDLCRALNIQNTTQVAQRLDEEERSMLNIGRQGSATFVTESGMYTVILRSDSPLAKPMQKWVTSEVLPAIRKTGGYIITEEDDTPETILAKAVLVANDTIERLKRQNEEKSRQLALAQKQLEYHAPVISYANEVLSSSSDHTATTIAAQFNMSAIILNKLLLKAGFLRKTRGEYSISAKYQGFGYTVTTTFIFHSKTTGDNLTSIGLRYTESGRRKIAEIIERAKAAGVLKEVKGRLFINNNYIPKTA